MKILDLGGYPIFMDEGILKSRRLPLAGRCFLVTDMNVARRYPVAAEWAFLLFPGEQGKNLDQAQRVLRAMADAGVTRDDRLVALGGGVVGDLAGFCAATYQRGIRWYQVPTTLVAQVDAAYGGKTGVNLPEGKNLVGAYHAPSAVVVDPAALETLPPEEMASGWAEVIKTALVAGGELWERVRRASAPDSDIIQGCIDTKLRIVAEDEFDEGRRQVLNLGHTVGHALEATTKYGMRHGEGVAIGLLCALRLSELDDLRAEVAALLERHGLPTEFKGSREWCNADLVLSLITRDKKRRGDEVPFVLVDRPGRVTHGNEVPERDLRAALREVLG